MSSPAAAVFSLEQVRDLGFIVVDGIVHASSLLLRSSTSAWPALTAPQLQHLALRCVSPRRREHTRIRQGHGRLVAVPSVPQPLGAGQVRRQAASGWGGELLSA